MRVTLVRLTRRINKLVFVKISDRGEVGDLGTDQPFELGKVQHVGAENCVPSAVGIPPFRCFLCQRPSRLAHSPFPMSRWKFQNRKFKTTVLDPTVHGGKMATAEIRLER